MRSLVAFICLAQLLSWAAARSPGVPVAPVRDPDCDDLDVEQAALAAVQYVNNNHKHGYKYTLNQVDKARVYQRRPTGEVYVLEIDLVETCCHVLDPTPLENCTVRQLTEHAVEGDCDVSVLKVDNQFMVLNAKCESSPDSAEDVRKICPNCPLLAPLNDTKVVHAVEAALTAFNAQKHNNYFKLQEISRAQFSPLQSSVYTEFVTVPTDCKPIDVIDPAACNPLPNQHGFCKGTLTEKVGGGEDVVATCTVFVAVPAVPAPQPDGIESSLGPAVPAEPAVPAGPPVAAGPAVALGPLLVDAPAVLPAKPILTHLPHHDLRHSIVGGSSFESASGEYGLNAGPVAPGPGPGPAAPAIPLCPGRIRHFKI
ncbi:alpha-2-HS-glycoprotein [Sarcophilus harrisii]|uniref:Alpha-2-HS-glycoprotein n=1 Tax=Sarcophilus harrisii TaxID=9305 RepID=G3VEN1_SARHA|nr:alpha-2-HS-glycoprotein [Sarcophilus harrisii]